MRIRPGRCRWQHHACHQRPCAGHAEPARRFPTGGGTGPARCAAGKPPLVHDRCAGAGCARLCGRAVPPLGLARPLAIPLHKHDRLVAAIGVHQRAPRRWLSAEIELVRLVVARCWESMQRAKAQQQLAANEARLRRLANTLPQIIFIADPDGRYYYSTSAGTSTPAWILPTTKMPPGTARTLPMVCACPSTPGAWH
ncbi:GAF domain-containing protein [Xanthomonas citri]|uniref:GAF domain-containing protein n=1 Tax=Xanthomonas citri TaxID=346 RepID=UPI0030EC8391